MKIHDLELCFCGTKKRWMHDIYGADYRPRQDLQCEGGLISVQKLYEFMRIHASDPCLCVIALQQSIGSVY